MFSSRVYPNCLFLSDRGPGITKHLIGRLNILPSSGTVVFHSHIIFRKKHIPPFLNNTKKAYTFCFGVLFSRKPCSSHLNWKDGCSLFRLDSGYLERIFVHIKWNWHKRFVVDGYKSKVFSGDVTVITWYFNEQFNIHCAFIVIIVWSDSGHHLILNNEQFD